jgi:N-acetyl-anhydromuramyl-L-alanine amidase AmpD
MVNPWPYEDVLLPAPPEPRWTCPEGLCDCTPSREHDQRRQLAVMLYDHHGRAMSGARFRVHVYGRVIDDELFADAAGWAGVLVRGEPDSVVLEWAPADTPHTSPYPYRMRYYVVLPHDDPDEADRRRLHNLGYQSGLSTRQNVAQFQADLGYPHVNGRLDDIRRDLALYHDEGRFPSHAYRHGANDFDPDAVGEADDPSPANAGPAPADAPPEPADRAPDKAGGSLQHPGKGSGKVSIRVTVNCFSFFALSFPAAMRDNAGRIVRMRWGAGDSHPVTQAEVRLFDTSRALVAALKANNRTTLTNRLGQVTLDLTAIPDGAYLMTIVPQASEELRPRTSHDVAPPGTIERPAGPWDAFTSDTAGQKRLRWVEIDVELRAGTMTAASVPSHLASGAANNGGSHEKVFLENAGTLWVDWRPDRVQIPTDGTKAPPARPGPPNVGSTLSMFQLIHLHHTEGPTPGSAIDGFLTVDGRGRPTKGAHYVIDMDGHWVQLADETQSVRHAGRAHWFDLDSCRIGNTIPSFNAISVGIEHVHLDGQKFATAQVSSSAFLVGSIMTTRSVPIENVLGDGETAINFDDDAARKSLGRKVRCPGADFEWPMLELQGAAIAATARSSLLRSYDGFFAANPSGKLGKTEGSAAAILDLQDALMTIGYFVTASGTYDDRTMRAVEAFVNRHFSGSARRKQLLAARDASGRPAADLDTVLHIEGLGDARTINY